MNNAFSNMDITKMMKVAQSIGELTRNKAANIEVVAYTGAGENQDVSQADYVISSYV